MKKLLLTIVTALLCSVFSTDAGEPAKVYVVMSQTAHAYHCTRNCDGLRRATHPIREVSLDEAVSKLKRRPCKLCYGYN